MKSVQAIFAGAAVFCLALFATLSARAEYPERPITLMVSFPAGGSTDISIRVLATAMEKVLGQPVVVENIGGGGGAVGLGKLYNAKPDGYYIGAGTTSMAVLPHAVDVAYDLRKFSYIGKLVALPFVLVVHPSLPVNSVQDLMAYGKSHPGALIMSTSGGFSLNDIGIALMSERNSDFEYRILPAGGSAATITRMLAGDANVTFVSSAMSLEHIKAGKLRPLAVVSDVSTPALNELGLARFQDLAGFSTLTQSNTFLIGPPGLPENIRLKLESALHTSLQDPAISKRLSDLDFVVSYMPGAEVAKETIEQFEVFGKVAQKVLKKDK